MATAATSQSIKTTPSKQDSHVSQASRKAYTINNSVYKIYTESHDSLSATAIYNEKRKHGVFSMPGYPTVGVPTNSSGMFALWTVFKRLTFLLTLTFFFSSR